MIDNIKIAAFVSIFPFCEKKPDFIMIGMLKLMAVKSLKNFEIVKYQCEYKNLLFTLNERELVVTNSLHKLVKGNNYSDFSLSELIKAIDEIEKITEISASVFSIRKLEFALNILMPLKGIEYLIWFSDLKGKPFDKMRSGQTWYGIKYYFTEYSVKIYDKSKQVNIQDRININQNLLRFEMQCIRQRKLPIAKRLSDLREPKILNGIFNDYIKIIQQLKCAGNEDFSNLKTNEKELYFAGKDQEYWNVLKAQNTNTYKTRKKKFKEIQKSINPTDLIDDFVVLLTEKFNYLIKS